ncbi:hypothetical protein [Aeoliella sp.]|uniref:hypothetical protein n=1 Tax=Aeoliella sp. TaxID=2795800 RepID=UPI003CCC1530
MRSKYRTFRKTQVTSGCLALVSLVGCGGTGDTTTPVSSAPPATVEAHQHPSEGPHHGGLIELGDEEYHAELVHNEEDGSVTIYLLDSTAKKPVSIDGIGLTINLSHEGQAKQFTLNPKPDSGDLPGASSRFVSSDPELAEELDHEGVDAQLVALINGKQFRAKITHEHDHDGHDHNH